VGEELMYIPLKIELNEPIAGLKSVMDAMRLPKNQTTKLNEDIQLAGKLIRAGDEHAKAIRGINAYIRLECQCGWLIEYLTYQVGVTPLSSSSSMHNELKTLKGPELAEQKQEDLVDKVYTRIDVISYQTLRRIYKQRKGHRHPDWKIFLDFIETLPEFKTLILPEINLH